MQTAVRLALVVLMLASLVLAAEMPHAFDTGGWLIAVVYVLTQVGRGAFIIWALRGEQLQKTFWRATAWSVLAAVPMLAGAAVPGHGRELLWAAAVAIELVGAAIGFQTAGLGRSHTSDWTIDGRHFAERCQAFVPIAIGESIIVIGGRLTTWRNQVAARSRRSSLPSSAASRSGGSPSTAPRRIARASSGSPRTRAGSDATPSTGSIH